MGPFIEKYSGANLMVQPMPGAGGYSARNSSTTPSPTA